MEFFVPLLVFIVILLLSSVRIIQEYERGVIYTLGRYTSNRGPGVQLIVPGIQRALIVDMRIRTEYVPSQDVISRDNVSVKVNAVLYYRVVDPSWRPANWRKQPCARFWVSMKWMKCSLNATSLITMCRKFLITRQRAGALK